MTPEELSAWTPVALTVEKSDLAIEWCDLRGVDFREPFFTQTVARWTRGENARPVVRTGFSALLATDGFGTCLEPSGFIFHMSRCGSTVVSRMLGRKAGTVVVSEAEPINALLEMAPERASRDVQVRCLRLLIRALGRCRSGNECHYVVKFSSWTINRLSLLREAFPRVPWVWVYREPAAVLASVVARPPGWMHLRFHPRLARSLLGIADPTCAASPAGFAAQALTGFSAAALDTADGTTPFVNYRDLPDAVWQTVAPTFGMDLDPEDIAAMKAEADWSAHDPTPTRFVPRTPGSGPEPGVPPSLDELYRKMETRSRQERSDRAVSRVCPTGSVNLRPAAPASDTVPWQAL